MRRESLRLPADEDCVQLFRQYVRLACHQVHRDGLLDPVLQVANELVANAIVHTTGGAERFVELTLVPTQRGVRVEVSDGDPTPPRVPVPTAVDGRPHGLGLVQSLASKWGYDPTTTGKTVWVDVEP